VSASIKWVGPPRSYTVGRPRDIRFIVLHDTEGSEGPDSAENGAAYDKRRTDGVSTHYFTDSAGPALQEVADRDQAHAALYHGNAIGIQIEICGRASQTRAQWLDAASRPTLETTAALVAHLCQAHDIPPVRLTTAQCRAAWYATPSSRPKGIVDHGTVTKAFPEDGGTHTDVGSNFPWDVFMTMVEEEMGKMDNAEWIRLHQSVDGVVDPAPPEWPASAEKDDGLSLNSIYRSTYSKAHQAAADAKLAVELAKDNAAALARIEAAIAAGPVPAPVDGTLSGDVTFTPKT